MHTPSDDAIRDRAYALWVEAGSPEGDGMDFWLTAEQELAAQEQSAQADGEMIYPETSEAETPDQPTQH